MTSFTTRLGLVLGLVLGLASFACGDDDAVDESTASLTNLATDTSATTTLNPTEVTPPLTLSLTTPDGEALASARVNLELYDGTRLEGLTDDAGAVTFPLPTEDQFPITLEVDKDGIPGLTTELRRDLVIGHLADFGLVPVDVLLPTEQPWWVEVSGPTPSIDQPRAVLTVSATVPGTTTSTWADDWAIRLEPGEDFHLVATRWLMAHPDGVRAPNGVRRKVVSWATLGHEAVKADTRVNLDLAVEVDPTSVAGLVAAPEWTADWDEVNLYVQVTSRDTRGALFAGAARSVGQLPDTNLFLYAADYVTLKTVKTPVTVYTLFDGDVSSHLVADGYPGGVAPSDFVRPPVVLSPQNLWFDQPLVWQMAPEPLPQGTFATLTVFLHDGTGAPVWAAVLNGGDVPGTSPLASDVRTPVGSYTFPPQAFGQDARARTPFTATVVYCTWEGDYDGFCDRMAQSRPTVIDLPFFEPLPIPVRLDPWDVTLNPIPDHPGPIPVPER